MDICTNLHQSTTKKTSIPRALIHFSFTPKYVEKSLFGLATCVCESDVINWVSEVGYTEKENRKMWELYYL